MKKVSLIFAAGALFFNSGCAAIRDELRYPGGAPGRMLDERTFDSSRSKQLQLLRAGLALAIAARIGEGSVATEDADVFARQLSEAATEINYAAIEAGYPQWVNGRPLYACPVPRGGDRPGTPADGGRIVVSADYLATDAACPGYYTAFEANIARIEARIVRAMLTSLPTETAREFIEDLTAGNLLSALVSLARATGDVAGAFHRGAGAYRAGLETVAASTNNCHPEGSRLSYDQRFDTVLGAADCLGLSTQTLFDGEDIAAERLPNQIRPEAFMALFRIAATACVALPLANYPDAQDARLQNDRNNRAAACGSLRFNPRPRPSAIINAG